MSVQQPGTGISLDDIYFTVFRHKRIILLCLCLGLVGVAVTRFVSRPVYSSQAKLLVRYVVDARDINPNNRDARIREADASGQSILNSEMEILTSLDLAKQVAEIVGPKRILDIKGGGTNLLAAAFDIRSGISATTSRGSDVLVVSFEHPDRGIVQVVLVTLIETYLRKHVEVRQSTGFSENYYSEQLFQLRKKLARTEEELKKVLTEAKVISIEEAKRTYGTQMEKLKGDLLAAKADLYARKATLGEDVLAAASTNSIESSVPADKLDFYANVLVGLNDLRKRERELLLQYTEAHPSVTATRASIARLKEKKAELEHEYPGLALSDGGPMGVDKDAERAQIRALSAKVLGYENLLTNLQSEALNLLTLEPRIAELQRQRDQEEKNFVYVSSSLDKSRADEVGGNKVAGIRPVEEPTPPDLNKKKMYKMMVMVFGAFVAFGLGVAALIDYVLDRTIKRSVDVRRHMRLPFFLSIPNTCWNGRIRLPKLLLNRFTGEKSSTETVTNGTVSSVIPAWDPDHHLRLYSEGLRERLITYFEVTGANHRSKLVGVTSCGEGAGVTTLASGVAAALSKTGDGNVLLVDMNKGQGATHSFYKGKPGCGLADALEPDARAEAQVQENLYVATLRPSDSPGAASDTDTFNKLLPSRFNKIMPELKASDYDYIIFDMPPVTPTSVTPRLAGNMDMVLLVLESEKTGQQVAVRAGELLAEAHANAAVVLNKCRQHVPAMLSDEL